MLGRTWLLLVALAAVALVPHGVAAAPAPPQAVIIAGYSGDAAEPFLSRDGRWLFFNSGYAAGTNTDLFAAERVDDLHFVFRGPVAGANSSDLDAVASTDVRGEFFFISPRSYDKTQSTVYRGTLSPAGASLADVALVPGLQASGPAKVVFDAEVSPDGNWLLFAEGQYVPYNPLAIPATADLQLARRGGAGFVRDPSGSALFANVNSPALEYAPALSPDGLTLSFTRLSAGPAADPQIFLATRPNLRSPFGPPARVSAATGYVEAATFSPDGRAIYFHHKVGNQLRIERLPI
ncbi:MAG: PD40 domain-containing protein [Actinobacteria bacterium]|nr:PD40 domain-containing protein [Actinomycetota bacterium]